MDMLSFSKDREPALEPADLNETVADVVELMQSRAEELGVALDWTPAAGHARRSSSTPTASIAPS